MNDLFIQAPQFEKTAYKRVSENPSEWTANVMEAFYNQFPSFSNSKVSVNFTQKDEAKGYAIGHISIEEGVGMVVPIVIKDRELYPFDVAIVNGNAMPLTNATIQMYIENRGAFWKLVKPDAGDITNALFNTSFSQSITPTYMHETYKQAEVADMASEKADKHIRSGKPFTVADKTGKPMLQFTPAKLTPEQQKEFEARYKQAEYNDAMSMQEDNLRMSLKERLANQIVANPAPEDVTITGLVKGKTPLPQDFMLKKMQEQALMGGQMKANELFLQMKKDYGVRGSDSLLYMMLCFKKWAGDQGIKTSGWDVPGFQKSAGVADWFFDEDVNFLSQHSGITRTKLNEAKQKDKERFSKLYLTAKKAKESGGDIRAALAISMAQAKAPANPLEGGPQSLTDKTQMEAMKVSQNVEPALGVTPFSKQGSCCPDGKCPQCQAVAKDPATAHVPPKKPTEGQPLLPTNEKNQYKTEEFISKISSTISSEMKDKFFDVLQKDASVVEGFKVNGTAGLVLKIAAVNPQPVNFTEKVRQELDRDIHYIYKSGSHEFTGIFGNSRVADPVRITLDSEAAQKISAIKTAELDESGPELEKLGSVKYAFTANGRKYAVLTNHNYIEFSPGAIVPLDEDGMFKFAESTLDITEPLVTKNAMWKIDGRFTEPFEVTRVWNENGQERVEVFTGLEKRAYTRMQGIDVPHEENGMVYLPVSAQFVKLGEKIEVPEKIIDNPMFNNAVQKTAENQYLLKGRVFSEFLKKEGAIQDLHGTAWNMIQCGARKADIEKLASMQVGDVLPLKYDLRIPHTLDKVASLMEKRYIHDADVITDLAKNFIKEAAAFNDPQTVDMVLSLNFVNKNNILEFVEALPMFAQTSQKLADMLLKARLGVTLVDEGAIRRTMLGMVEIMDVLNGVQNLLEKK